jgi:hypothetical protein
MVKQNSFMDVQDPLPSIAIIPPDRVEVNHYSASCEEIW